MGRLAAPNLIVKAAAPFAAGLALTALEPRIVLVVLAVAAACNALLALTLMFRAGRSLGSQGRAM